MRCISVGSACAKCSNNASSVSGNLKNIATKLREEIRLFTMTASIETNKHKILDKIEDYRPGGICGPKVDVISAVLIINKVSIFDDFGHFGHK